MSINSKSDWKNLKVQAKVPSRNLLKPLPKNKTNTLLKGNWNLIYFMLTQSQIYKKLIIKIIIYL